MNDESSGFSHSFGNINEIISAISLDVHHAYDDSPGNLIRGLSTGIAELDETTFGMHPGELIVMGSRPGMGAQPLAQRILLHVACESKRPVVFFSLVNSPKKIAYQLLSIAADVNWFHVKSGGALDERWEAISKATGQLYQQPIAIESLQPHQFQDLLHIAKTYRESLSDSLGLIVIDGFEQLIFSDQSFDQDTARRAAVYALRALAQDLQVPILLIVSLDRRMEDQQEITPALGDLPRFGDLEILADSILLIWRDRLYPPKSGKDILAVGIPKSLHGFVGIFGLDSSLGLFGQK
jgi:replicative DNA helicase